MKKTLLAIVGFVLVMSAVFSGGATEKSKEAENVTLRVSWWGGNSRHTPTLGALAAYSKINPNVKFESEK